MATCARGSVLVALVAAACQAPGGKAPPRVDAQRYKRCQDPVGAAALERARKQLARGEPAAALADLQAALGVCPEDVRTHLAYADAAERVGGEAEKTMRARYAVAESASPVVHYMAARFSDDEYTREQHLLQALSRDASFYWAYLSLARLHRNGHRTAKAIEYLDQALGANPSFAEARLELAQVYEGLGRYEEAEVEYANYLRAQPTDRVVERAYMNLLVYQLRRADQAFEIAERLIAEDPGDIELLMTLGAIYWTANKPAEAAARYRRVLQLDPSRARAVLNLGNLYYDYWDGFGGGSGEDAKREAWTKARQAYRFYLGMKRTEGMFDFADYHLGVPYRLAQIESLLGPAPTTPPSLEGL